MSSRPVILVTNDDGITHPGLFAAARAAAAVGDVLVVGPATAQSSTGRSYPRGEEVGVLKDVSRELPWPAGVRAYSLVGSPALCVAHAVLELSNELPDLCISGVNFGENLGTTLTGSGTIGATFEADCFGIPGLAVSLQTSSKDRPETVSWAASEYFTEQLARMILSWGLPPKVGFLNVNIPQEAANSTPIRRTRDSRQPFWIFTKPERSDLSTPVVLPVEAQINRETLEPDSDIQACMIDKVVSVTPIANSLVSSVEWDLPSITS